MITKKEYIALREAIKTAPTCCTECAGEHIGDVLNTLLKNAKRMSCGRPIRKKAVPRKRTSAQAALTASDMDL